MADCIRGVSLVAIEVHKDARGELGVIEAGEALGFDVRRIFYIKAASADVIRAEHAVSAARRSSR